MLRPRLAAGAETCLRGTTLICYFLFIAIRGQRPDYHMQKNTSPGCSKGNFTTRTIIPFQLTGLSSDARAATFLLHHKLTSILSYIGWDFNEKAFI